MTDTTSLTLDKNFREIVRYGDPAFPLEIWTGHFDGLISTGLPLHWHPEFEYGVILKGRMVYTFQEYSVELGAGDCVFVNSDRMHYTIQKDKNEPVSMYTIAFPPSLLCESMQSPIYQRYISPETALDFQGLIIKKDNEHEKNIHQILQTIYDSRAMQYGFELQTLSLVYRLWLETLQYLQSTDLSPYLRTSAVSSKDSEVIKRALIFIYAHYAEKLTVEDIASAAYISRNSCFRYFHNSFGKSPFEVLNEHRLSVAASLLTTEKPITDIALSCGFGSSSYFTRIFHAKFGMTPKEYRTMKKKKLEWKIKTVVS